MDMFLNIKLKKKICKNYYYHDRRDYKLYAN